METYEYLLMRVQPAPNKLYVLEPYIAVETNLQNVSDSNTVALLDELGSDGWDLLSVDESNDGRFWLKRRIAPNLGIPDELPPLSLGI